MEEDVTPILKKLGRGQLHAITAMFGFNDFSSRLTQDYIDKLTGIEWTEERINALETFYLEQFMNKSSYDISLLFFPDVVNISELSETFSNSLVEDINTIYNSQRDDGFQIITQNENTISGNYYFATDKIIPDIVKKSVTKVRIMNSIKFDIDGLNKMVKLLTNQPAFYNKFRKIFRENTDIELKPKGLHDHSNDSMERVRQFLRNYPVKDAEKIYLWFPQTLRDKIVKIKYDGNDIFNDTGVKNHISNDNAVVTGFVVQIEYGGYNFRVKVGSNKYMGYVSVKTGRIFREAKALAEDMIEKYRTIFI